MNLLSKLEIILVTYNNCILNIHQTLQQKFWREKMNKAYKITKGPSLYYVIKGTGWVGQKTGSFC
jgi:hypothetical protein